MHIFCQDPERMNNTGSQYLQKKTLQMIVTRMGMGVNYIPARTLNWETLAT